VIQIANLIEIFIVNFHYDLIMSNTGYAVQQFYKKKEGYLNMYGYILYIIIY